MIIFMLRVILNEEYRVLADRDCNINVKLNHKIPTKFHNQKQS